LSLKSKMSSENRDIVCVMLLAFFQFIVCMTFIILQNQRLTRIEMKMFNQTFIN